MLVFCCLCFSPCICHCICLFYLYYDFHDIFPKFSMASTHSPNTPRSSHGNASRIGGWRRGGWGPFTLCVDNSNVLGLPAKSKVAIGRANKGQSLCFFVSMWMQHQHIYGYCWIFARSKLSKRGAGENGICNDAQQRQRQPRSATFNF